MKAVYPRVSGQLENFWLSVTVKVRASFTASPDSVLAVGVPESGCTFAKPSMYWKNGAFFCLLVSSAP